MHNDPYRWIAHRRPSVVERPRLFCFPYAGGGASAYRGWADLVGHLVEVCPVELPGRETRLREPPFTQFAPMILSVLQGLVPLMDRPFAFFGHSMGALIAFELAHRLRHLDMPEPIGLLLSGAVAPQVRPPKRLVHTLANDEFIDELRRLNGTPEMVLQNVELMEILLPLLRSDFAVDETYEYRPQPPLGCPLTVFGGRQDFEISSEGLQAWRQHSRGPFEVHMLDGDHFFLHTARQFPELLRSSLEQICWAPKVVAPSTEANP